MPIMFVLGMGVSAVSNKQSLKINKIIKASKKTHLSQSNNNHGFVRKQYQKSYAFHEQNKKIIVSSTDSDTNRNKRIYS